MAAPLINYHRQGSGTPLVLVHGIMASWQCWQPVLPALASRHDVIAIDLPGFGGSVDLSVEKPSLGHFAQSILDLLDSLGIDRFHVAGNSLGGAVSVELLRSERVLSFHGISAAGQTHGPYLNITKAVLRGSYYGARLIAPVTPLLVKLRPLRMAFISQMVGKPQKLTAAYALELMKGTTVGRGFERTLAHAIPGDRGIEIPAFDGPAQMLWGTRDLVLPFSALARYAELWDGLEVVPMKGLGHVPMQDDPKLVADTILKVTAKVDTGAALKGRPVAR